MSAFIKKVNNSDPGDADHVGGDDWDKLDDYFNKVATGLTARINSITRFYGTNLRIRNPADTFSYLHNPSAIVATRTVTYPLLTGDANFVFDSFGNTFSVAQKFDSYIDLKNVSDASVTSPASGYFRLYFSSTDGHLKIKRSTGDLVELD